MSKRLVLLAGIVMILGIVSAPAVFADIIIMPVESCRTDVLEPDTNNHDSSKLSIRSDAKSAKSWIKFDLGELDVGNLETATLTVALHEPKAGDQYFDVSYVNDDYLDNIGWDERSLTWNNAPGNNTADLGTLDTSRTTLLGRVDFINGTAGDSFDIDVLAALEADTDGIVQFVLHNSDNSLNFATHDHAQETWRPFIDATKRAKAQAKKPYPAKGATEVYPTPVLSWTPGEYVEGLSPMHKVFFSEDFNDVNDGIGAITQDANSYTPAQRLDFGKTYYWRVDEVNGPPDYTVCQGRVWSFTTELLAYPVENITVTASSTGQPGMGPENTINSSGLDANDLHSTEATDMWLSGDEPNAWIEYELDKVHKLHEMWVWNSNQAIEPIFGLGCKDVSIEYSVNGTDYTTLGTTHEFARAPGLDDYAHNTIVDLNDVAAKYVRLTANSSWGGVDRYGLSEVRFFSIPVQAREPSPDSGTTDVAVDVTLGFRAGREADKHDVYLSSDEQVVIDGNVPVATVAETSFGPLSLDLGTTYYWKINEVNDAETPTTWKGDIWNFTTHDFLVVDDFESYNDIPEGQEGSNLVYITWEDGYVNPSANGSTIGYVELFQPSMEMDIVHGGSKQSVPLMYDNSVAAYSEATRTFAVPQDWTEVGVQTLALYFYGTAGNTGQLYAKVNGSKVVYDGDAADIAKPLWNQWSIDLASLGVDLLNVTTLTIGMDGNGASGTLYFDDIRLALSVPATGVRSSSILFVSSLEAEHMPGDDAIKAFFEGLGHAVTYIDDDADEAPTEAAAAAADLVYISESVGSGDIKNEITEIETPIIVAEPYAWDEMGLTTANPEAIDQVPASVNITIINAAHPMAAGYSGDVPVFTALSGSDELIPVGTTGGGAVVIARGSGNVQTDADVYFVYEKGAALAAPPADGSPQVAADIRIGFFTASPTAEELLSNEGYDLLSAAVNYALGMTE